MLAIKIPLDQWQLATAVPQRNNFEGKKTVLNEKIRTPGKRSDIPKKLSAETVLTKLNGGFFVHKALKFKLIKLPNFVLDFCLRTK